MKKLLLFFFIIFLMTACNSQKKFTDFDISYSRSGGLSPIYENFLIKGNSAFYSFEGQGKNFSKNIKLSDEEVSQFRKVLSDNDFLKIEEDHRKLYDNISTRIRVKSGENAGSKSDASLISPKSQKNWENITAFFENFIKEKI